MQKMRGLLDCVIGTMLKIQLFDRMAGYLEYQRRRKTRRAVEQRLDAQGLYPDEVLRGPFRGMKLPAKSEFFDCRFEKVFGTYEHELFEVLDTFPDRMPRGTDVFVVGAADGFYAVGIALTLPGSKIHAYERETGRREMLEKIARLNCTESRTIVMGECTPESLNETLPTALSLVICDVDGYESDLFDPELVPNLRLATLLVETHDCFVPGVSDCLKKRFSESHSIHEIHMAGPDFRFLPVLVNLKMHEVESLVGSDRPMLQTWLFMIPRSISSN